MFASSYTKCEISLNATNSNTFAPGRNHPLDTMIHAPPANSGTHACRELIVSFAILEEGAAVVNNSNKVTFSELQYAQPNGKGPYCLYIYGRDGYHSGGVWFRKQVQHPSQGIAFDDARTRCEMAIAKKLEVRITDSGDNLIFHSVGGKVLYPDSTDFWKEAARG
jgi:hypothetical protein